MYVYTYNAYSLPYSMHHKTVHVKTTRLIIHTKHGAI